VVVQSVEGEVQAEGRIHSQAVVAAAPEGVAVRTAIAVRTAGRDTGRDTCPVL
jgi:hypothetical protein